MTYRSLRFPPSVPLFPHADQVRDYLSSCATSWNVDRFVRFRTLVKRVRLAHGGDGKRKRRWEVTSQRVGDDEINVDEFDHVAVCNGHYEKASLPEIPGLG
jgi:cation diffusion facilitator CzcD-associated flavoprotein CzcO